MLLWPWSTLAFSPIAWFGRDQSHIPGFAAQAIPNQIDDHINAYPFRHLMTFAFLLPSPSRRQPITIFSFNFSAAVIRGASTRRSRADERKLDGTARRRATARPVVMSSMAALGVTIGRIRPPAGPGGISVVTVIADY
jgi:hypothetical protein